MSPTTLTLANGVSDPKRVIVVGTGWAGLVAAKTYLEIDPTVKLTIIDSERTLGDVWNQDRIYPGFFAGSPVGLFDFSDLPMRDVTGLKDWADIPGQKIYDYLKIYSEKFYLTQRMRLGTKVSKIRRSEDGKEGWELDVQIDEKKREFEVGRVMIYGGCKSAVDTINLCILAGKKVEWVIRDTGNGPGMMAETRKKGYHGAIFSGRWKNILTPSIFSIDSFWYWFWHSGKSKLGNWLCRRMWTKMSSTPLTMEPYKTKSANIEKLYPETRDALFFTASVAALHGNEEFVKNLHSGELITVHRASITSMSGTTITLSDSEVFPSDAVVFATGWTTIAIELGISAPLQYQDATTASYWDRLQLGAEEKVLETLPILKLSPSHYERPVDYTPTRLYRYILPSSLAAQGDHSLVFLGLVTSIQTPISAEVSALWGVAWMEGILEKIHPLPTKAEMDYEIAKVNAWSARRYLSRGRQIQVAFREIQDVIDMWTKDLGLKVHRKGGLLGLRDAFVPYRAQDYNGIVKEAMERARQDQVG